jgi:hypothetical protein
MLQGREGNKYFKRKSEELPHSAILNCGFSEKKKRSVLMGGLS